MKYSIKPIIGDKMANSQESTSCYTYKVEMIIQVLAKDEAAASRKIDTEGGYQTSRKVTLMDKIDLYTENVVSLVDEEDEEDED
jgi:hypothetical protein